ncbi:MAG: hypothetical protein RLW62_23380 [Gammaproteobacteria bacterium]
MVDTVRARLRAPGPFSLLRAAALPALLTLALLSPPAAAHQQAKDAPQVLAPGYGALNYDAPAPGSYRLPPLGAAADGAVID